MWRHSLSFLVLLAFLFVGDALAHVARLPLPGSVLGMLLLAGSLRLGWIRPALVHPAAELLIRHMALLFVPAGVGLMTYFGLLGREWLPIVAASIVSTMAVMGVVGWMQQRLEPHA
jgi:holin-like protein